MVAPPAESFAMSVGDRVSNGMIGSTPAPGAGDLETTASKDVYTFSVPAGGQSVVFDSDRLSFALWNAGSQLVRVSDGANFGDISGHHVFDLAEGDYRVEVANCGYPGRTGSRPL